MLGYALVYKRTDMAVVELVLRLRFKLRVDELDGYDGGDTFAHVFTA